MYVSFRSLLSMPSNFQLPASGRSERAHAIIALPSGQATSPTVLLKFSGEGLHNLHGSELSELQFATKSFHAPTAWADRSRLCPLQYALAMKWF